MRSLLLLPVGILLRIYFTVAFVMVYFDKRKVTATPLPQKRTASTA